MRTEWGSAVAWCAGGFVFGGLLALAVGGGPLRTTLNDDCVTKISRGSLPGGRTWTRTERRCD